MDEVAFTTHDPACNRCRIKKIRCDRVSPRCKTCERDRVQCQFSDKGLKFIQSRVVVPHEELERRLGSVEDSIAEVIRTIKESEDRTHLRMLQWENRLLDRILSNGFKMSNPSNSFSFPEKTTNASPPVYNDGPSQNFSYAKSLACNDNNQWMIVPRQDMEYDFASKYRILYQHGPQAPSESLIPLAGSAPNQPTASQPVDWNAGGFGSVDLSVPNISGVANVFDFFNPSQAD